MGVFQNHEVNVRNYPPTFELEGSREMLLVETIRKVRMALAKGESQRKVAEKYRMSRNTIRKIANGKETEFKYAEREVLYP